MPVSIAQYIRNNKLKLAVVAIVAAIVGPLAFFYATEMEAVGAPAAPSTSVVSADEVAEIVETCSNGEVLFLMEHPKAFGDQTIGYEIVIDGEPKTVMVKPGKVKKKLFQGTPGDELILRVADADVARSVVPDACPGVSGDVRVTKRGKVKATFVNNTTSPHLFGGRLVTKDGNTVRLPTKLVYPGKTVRFGFNGLTLKRGEAVVTSLQDGSTDLGAALR